MDAAAEGVEVHVALPGHKAAAKHLDDPKSPANPTNVQQNSAIASSTLVNSTSPHNDLCGPSRCIWTLFVLGWVFPPFWWAAAAAGFRPGRDRQCLLLQRKGLSPSQKAAWHASLIMSMISAVAIIMAFAIHYGQLTAGSTATEGKLKAHSMHTGSSAQCRPLAQQHAAVTLLHKARHLFYLAGLQQPPRQMLLLWQLLIVWLGHLHGL